MKHIFRHDREGKETKSMKERIRENTEKERIKKEKEMKEKGLCKEIDKARKINLTP